VTDHRPSPRVTGEPLHLLVDAVTEYAIFMLDPIGNVTTWNEGALRIKGYDEAEIVGRHYSTFFINDDISAGKPQRLLADAAAHGQATDEGWRVRKDGSQFWENTVLIALFDDAGGLRGFAKVSRDDTERREAAVHAQALDTLLDHERIAHDLNASVISRIFGAGLILANLRQFSEDAQHDAHIDTAVEELDHAIRELRAIVLDL
jgi:PAS domain S-box-containing protein